jgi:penicillin-binding protein 1A
VDAWFIGFIPQLSTSVWVGYPDERRPMVNINGLPEINGENYPLDIWSLYMQDAVGMFPEQQFDVPSPYLNLEVKTDGRAVAQPERTEETDEPTESTDTESTDTEGTDTEGTGQEDNPYPNQPAGPTQPALQPASPPPQSASPAPQVVPPQPAPGSPGPRRGVPRR